MSTLGTHNEERDLVDREVLKRLIDILEEKSVGEITNSGEEVIIKDLAGNIKKSLKVHKRVSYQDRKPNMPMYGEEALKDADCALFSTDTQGNRYLVKPITRENCVEGLGRLRDTAYSVGDIALCTGSQSLQLICTASGTTSSNELDISANTEGDTITDGTVSWKVVKRNYLESDGVLPIANGGTGANNASDACANLGAVRTVNGKEPDAGGNVALAKLVADTKELLAKSDGTLTWDGKEIDRINSSGDNYIRYENGIQICWNNQVKHATWWTFPMPFKVTPGAVTSHGMGSTGGTTQSAALLTEPTRCYYKDAVGGEAAGHVIAIGWWK